MLRLLFGRGAVSNHPIESGFQQFGIMPIGSADDEGERDATAVGEQAAFASVFSPVGRISSDTLLTRKLS